MSVWSMLQPGRTKDQHHWESLVNVEDIRSKMDAVEDDFMFTAGLVQHHQIANMVDQALSHIEAGEVHKVAEIDVPYRRDLGKAVQQMLSDLYSYGMQQVEQELSNQGSNTAMESSAMAEDDPLTVTLLRTRALATANILAGKLRAALASEVLNQVRDQQLNRNGLIAALVTLGDDELAKRAKLSAFEALDWGRKAAAKRYEDSIAEVHHSTILGDNMCLGIYVLKQEIS